MTNSENKKCANSVCRCTVPDGKEHCGHQCESATKGANSSCECTHPTCVASK